MLTADAPVADAPRCRTGRLKVTLANSSLRGGGAERIVAWLASRLVADGHAVKLVPGSPAAADFYNCDSRVRIVRTGWVAGHRLARSIRVRLYREKAYLDISHRGEEVGD